MGARVILDDVSYEAPTGAIVALVGPNGAGKSTSLSLLLGLRRPDRGTASLFGADPRRATVRRRLGVTPQQMSFPSTLRVREVVELVRAHYVRPLPTDEICARFHLSALAGRQTGGLSGGEKRRLAVALAFVGSPDLVVLDEPTTGLDVESRQATWEAIRSYASEGGTILLTTHYLEEAEALASLVVVIDEGRVLADGTLAAIRTQAGLGRVRFRAEPISDRLAASAVREGEMITIRTADPTGVVRSLLEAGARLEALEVSPLPLEEALRTLQAQ
ncbi:MAG: ABC transporter ATP-binding protein [Gaiellaceae bacterium MAG52_C11]|nr:ABC transporter ATP-binding protein [Candidatus Gaiellasilicea maunaloa]